MGRATLVLEVADARLPWATLRRPPQGMEQFVGLKSKKCGPCEGKTPTLSSTEVEGLRQQVPLRPPRGAASCGSPAPPFHRPISAAASILERYGLPQFLHAVRSTAATWSCRFLAPAVPRTPGLPAPVLTWGVYPWSSLSLGMPHPLRFSVMKEYLRAGLRSRWVGSW